MRAYARKVGEDEETWGIAGMLHDFDWDACPSAEQHPQFGADILRERGYPEVIVRAVLSHGNHTGVPRESIMEKALARNINRDDLVQGAQDLGVDLDELIEFVVESLKPVAVQLGLAASD